MTRRYHRALSGLYITKKPGFFEGGQEHENLGVEDWIMNLLRLHSSHHIRKQVITSNNPNDFSRPPRSNLQVRH